MSSIWTIRRSATDAKLAGLCAGVARHWGIDPVLVRVGWALLALSGGVGFVLYVAGWLMIPVDGKDKAPVDDMFGDAARKWPRELWLTIVVLACVALFAAFGSASPVQLRPGHGHRGDLVLRFLQAALARRAASPARPRRPCSRPVQPSRVRALPGPPDRLHRGRGRWQRRMYEYSPRWRRLPRPPGPRAADLAHRPPAADARGLLRPTRPRSKIPRSWSASAFLATPDPVGLYAEPDTARRARRADPAGPAPSAKRLRLVSYPVLGLTLSGLGVADYLGADGPLHRVRRRQPAGRRTHPDRGHPVRPAPRSAPRWVSCCRGGAGALGARPQSTGMPHAPAAGQLGRTTTRWPSFPPAVMPGTSAPSRSI